MTTCPACLEPKESWLGTVLSPCGHTMCQQCFIAHIRLNPKATCPECRGNFARKAVTRPQLYLPVQQQPLEVPEPNLLVQQPSQLWAKLAAELQAFLRSNQPMEECN